LSRSLGASPGGVWINFFKKEMENESRKNEREKEEIIYGVENLEELFHRSYVSLFSIRNDYNFPMKSRNGVPSLDLAEWREFAAEYGLDPDHPEK